MDDLWRNVTERGGLHELMDQEGFAAAVRPFCDVLFAKHIGPDGAPPRWFVERTPTHARLLPLVASVYPDVWCIHVIRDGVAVAQSLMELEFGTSTYTAAAIAWRDVILAVRSAQPHLRRYREVRYEALESDPATIVADLLTWIGHTVDSDVLEAIEASAGRRVSQFAKHRAKGPIVTVEKAADFGRVAGALLLELGYEVPRP